jgi:serine/threonine protein kinase
MHRDIKPENILVLREADPTTQLPIAKLLDFGLSKHTGLGSGAKTFVGTPCYLAPEVEFASKTAGATYGTPADCWSLGAVLYVMLVARFPVFEVDNKFVPPRLKLSLPNELFRNISIEAKDLLLSLMNFDPNERLTAKGALSHPWLKNFRVPIDRLDTYCAPESKIRQIAAFSGSSTVPTAAPEPKIPAALSLSPSPRKSPTSSSLGLVKLQKPQVETALTTSDQLGITPLLVFQK